ncbi:MAG TPA: GNAT family N-acetyltransferase [Candidatus Omnitrophota bacterium]|nr:GNAT family N-acetyltransferase [Candidatus Omnitrophota bacterium]
MKNFVIRQMEESEMNFAVGQAAKEGWNPGLEDARAFYETDPEGFFIALLDGRPVGCVSAVSYGSDFAFVGFYIVLAEFRGQGFGIQLGQTALARLKTTRAIGLDGVLAQQKNYERAGFRPAYGNTRYEYKMTAPLTVSQTTLTVPASAIDRSKIGTYDRQCFPAERKVFLEKWLAMKNTKAFGWVERGSLKGYGVIRKCDTGYKIGPLFADNESIANELFLRLCSSVRPPEMVYLDIPEVNPAGLRLASSFGMRPVFTTTRMYLGPAPDIRLDKIFGITSFELG